MTTETAPPKRKSKPGGSRSYTQTTIKVLFGSSGNQCVKPGCTNCIIEPATDYSDALVVGQISHIYAASDNGPRGRPDLTTKQRNHHTNLVLLCPTHHRVVDGQHATYPATMLLEWKRTHEQRVQDLLSQPISDTSFVTLEVAARALISQVAAPEDAPTIIPPAEKIARNSLGSMSATLIKMGSAKSREVEAVILREAQLDPEFPDRLKGGFVAKYSALRESGLTGDALFLKMYAWAGGNPGDLERQAAGLCLLSHLFIVCDVFERQPT